MMLLNVFSKPLHIPEAFQWGVDNRRFCSDWFSFLLNKGPKTGKAEATGTGTTDTKAAAGVATIDSETEQRKKTKQRLWLMMGLGSGVGLCAPLWLPLTGTTLGPKGDFVVGLITVATCCTIIGLRLRKL